MLWCVKECERSAALGWQVGADGERCWEPPWDCLAASASGLGTSNDALTRFLWHSPTSATHLLSHIHPNTTCLPKYNLSAWVQLCPKHRIKFHQFPSKPGQQFGWTKDRLSLMLKPNTSSFFVLFSFSFHRLRARHTLGDIFPSFGLGQLHLQPSSSTEVQWVGAVTCHFSSWATARGTKPVCNFEWVFLPSLVDLGNSGKTMYPHGSPDFSHTPSGTELLQLCALGPNGTDWQEWKETPKKRKS